MASDKTCLNWIGLSTAALQNNIASLSRLTAGKLMAVCVKGNAYGHGLKEIITMVKDSAKVHYLTVHSLDEAATCREAGWKKNIMLLGPLPLDNVEAVLDYDLEPVVFNSAFLTLLGKKADKHGKAVKTHLKLETGTNRQGVTGAELPAFAKIYKAHASLKKPFGASMHFANIEDTTSHDYAEFQLGNFNNMVKAMTALGIKPSVRHTASSAAAILFDKTHFEMVRPGIAVYGHWPSKETYLSYRLEGGENDLFHPVLSWKTRVTQLKRLAADSFVGYGCTYRTTSPAKLAILPIGYYDGYSRALSNQAYVLIRGKRAPVRGRICMNLTMVDVTDIREVKLEDETVLIGASGQEAISAERLAAWAGTINYEILARLSPQTPRLIVG